MRFMIAGMLATEMALVGSKIPFPAEKLKRDHADHAA